VLTEDELVAMRETYGMVLSQTCTRRRYATPSGDAEGNVVRGTVTPATYPCKRQRTTATERIDGKDTQIVEDVLLLPFDADVTGRDQITIGADVYEVVGTPDRWEDGFTIMKRARLKTVA
jgi:hypothetical protein